MRAPREFGRLGPVWGILGASKLDLGRFPDFPKMRPEKVTRQSETDSHFLVVNSHSIDLTFWQIKDHIDCDG